MEVGSGCWRASFQRRALDGGRASNRGVLPMYPLPAGPDETRVLVPLPDGEALWVAFSISLGVSVRGAAADGSPIRVAPVAEAHAGRVLLCADAIETARGPSAIDSSLSPAAHAGALKGDHLVFTIASLGPEPDAKLGVVLATTALYEALSGRLAPSPAGPGDVYGGWRLP
jgi:hypothetical protein